MPTTKPVFTINLDLEVPEAGGVGDLLSKAMDAVTYEKRYNLRHPVGIYNISVIRLSSRIARVADAVVNYMLENSSLEQPEGKGNDNFIGDNLEACIYAAAEHVDDLESCLKCLFPSEKEAAKSKACKTFKADLRHVRRNMSAYANAIKHQQARIRLYRLGFAHDGKAMVLIGFFIEGVKDGRVGPSPILHDEQNQIIAISSFLWEVIFFVHLAADLLAKALAELLDAPLGNPMRERWSIVQDGIVATARLPNFTLDGPHPFEHISLRLGGEKQASLFLRSDLYGSIGNKWSNSEDHSFHGTMLEYQGDGITKDFALADPKQVKLQHWK
jgi:hypothetical protein